MKSTIKLSNENRIIEIAKVDPRAAGMMQAWLDGEEWANSLEAGSVFRGSMGEAKHRGLDEDCASMFCSAAYNLIKNWGIYCPMDSFILTRVTRPEVK